MTTDIIKVCNLIMYQTAQEFGVPLGALVNTKFKPGPVSPARREMVVRMRKSVFYRGYSRKTREYSLKQDATGGDWRPLATADVAILLGCDHTAVMAMLRRAMEESEVVV